jgi:hypothetical protein
MRVCELMVGDLVLHDGKVIRVDAVHKRKIGYHKTKDKLTWLFSGQFEPIPLTPEILDKNADFHRDEKYYKYYVFSEEIDIYGNSISVEICESRGTVYWTINGNEYGITKLKYVHELQHVLRLCKIGKEIII